MSSTPETPETPDLTASIPPVLVAVRAMNGTRIVALLDEAVACHGYDATMDEVIFPVLRVVGTFWANGMLNLAHEHFLSSTLTRWVYAKVQQQAPRRDGRLLLAAGPEDLHVLGLDCLELLLAHRGVDVANLGGRVPVDSLVLAARSVGAAAVVVCSHNPSVTTQAVRAVRAVAEAGFATYYAGSSFESQFVRQHTPGEPLDAPLSTSAALLTGRHTVAQASRALVPPPRLPDVEDVSA